MPTRAIWTACLLLAMTAWSPASAACLDLPARLLLFASKGQTVHVVDLSFQSVGQIKLDCTLTSDDWGKLQLSRKTCTDTSLPKPDGSGQCRVIDVVAVPGRAPDGAKFEYVIRRNLPE